MFKKALMLSGILIFSLFGVISQGADAASYGASPEETRKLVRNLAGRWCCESAYLMDYYDLIVTGDNTFILRYNFSTSKDQGQAVPKRLVLNMTVEGDSLRGTNTYWVDYGRFGASVEEKTFPVTGMISNNGNTINITFDQPWPNVNDGGRWTDYEGKVYWVFSRAR